MSNESVTPEPEDAPDVELPEDPAGDGVVTPEPEDAPDVELPEVSGIAAAGPPG